LALRLDRMAAGGPCTLLLHFSGYGYHPRGLCAWLVREVVAARRAFGSRLHVVTMFHELFASGPPWRSAFWLQRLQAGIAANLARASDAVWTNSSHHADWLRGCVRPGTTVRVEPVFSTIGEPGQVTPWQQRARQLVVFGSASTRGRALQGLPPHVAGLNAQGIHDLLEVGSGAPAWSGKGLQHRHLGSLDPAALGPLLQGAAYALIDYPSVHLGKSTVYAGYVAHGCLVLNTAAPGPDADGLQAGLHYQSLGQPGRRWLDEPQAMVDAARAWYAQHALPKQLQDFAAACQLGTARDQAAERGGSPALLRS
jgi:hypothetical protein